MGNKKFLIIVLVVCSTGCIEITQDTEERNARMESISSEVFAEIEPGDSTENKCTPKVGEDFIGFRINAPTLVSYNPGEEDPFTGAFAKVMICGVYRFDAALAFEVGGIEKSLTLVAIDTESHTPYSGQMVSGHLEIPESPPRQYPPEVLENLYYKRFLNINILDYLGLPEKPATYNVFVTLKEYKSNVVTIKLIEKKTTETD